LKPKEMIADAVSQVLVWERGDSADSAGDRYARNPQTNSLACDFRLLFLAFPKVVHYTDDHPARVKKSVVHKVESRVAVVFGGKDAQPSTDERASKTARSISEIS
jgi:hypothetical protein